MDENALSDDAVTPVLLPVPALVRAQSQGRNAFNCGMICLAMISIWSIWYL
jgi:hypothetical protein